MVHFYKASLAMLLLADELNVSSVITLAPSTTSASSTSVFRTSSRTLQVFMILNYFCTGINLKKNPIP